MRMEEVKKKRVVLLKYPVYVLLFLLITALTIWAMEAIYFSNLPLKVLRCTASLLFPCITAIIFWWVCSFRRALLIYAILFSVILIWWWCIPPSNDRQWQPDVSILCHAEINGDDITIHNVRNFDYRSTNDYTPQYYDKTFSLSNLQTADLYIVFWGAKLIAHTMMSFGFGDQGYVCISIETRKEKGEAYSAIKGFFKQYELIYIVADERDLVRLRTNYRYEDVYLYRLKADPQLVREVFLDYFKQINRLVQESEWYNALTHNCTTAIRGHTRPYTKKRPLDWRLLANGYLDTLLYDRKVVDTNIPFKELEKQVHINETAVQWDGHEDFSNYIREGLPGMAEIQ